MDVVRRLHIGQMLACGLCLILAACDLPPQRLRRTNGLLEVDNPRHDFGTFWAGPILRHEFRITNVSPHILWVNPTRAGGSWYPIWFRIEPGEIVALDWPVYTKNLRGKFESTVTLHSKIEKETVCTRCWHAFESEEHLQKCGSVCADRPHMAEGCYVVGKLDPPPGESSATSQETPRGDE